jgi:putative nucleotidyltransferase with HDIG domain
MISDQLLHKYKTWFTKYTQAYLNSNEVYNENITLKIDHTYRVISEIKELAKDLEFSHEDTNLAEVIALFHDIGRFEQYANYRTFSDKRSENHSIIGVNELRNNHVFDDLKSGQQDFIYRIILYHNRASLPTSETPKCLLFAKLLRDADKLDVFNLITNYYENKEDKRNTSIELELPDTDGFNYSIYNDLMNESLVLLQDVKNLNDFKLLQLGWIFDINFTNSFRKIHEQNYVSRLLKQLPVTNETREIDIKLTHYINNKLKQTA